MQNIEKILKPEIISTWSVIFTFRKYTPLNEARFCLKPSWLRGAYWLQPRLKWLPLTFYLCLFVYSVIARHVRHRFQCDSRRLEVDSKFNLNAFRLPYGFHRMYRTRLFPVACLDRAQASGALDLRWSTTALVQPSTVSGFLFLSLVLLLARPRVSSGLASSISMRPSRV